MLLKKETDKVINRTHIGTKSQRHGLAWHTRSPGHSERSTGITQFFSPFFQGVGDRVKIGYRESANHEIFYITDQVISNQSQYIFKTKVPDPWQKSFIWSIIMMKIVTQHPFLSYILHQDISKTWLAKHCWNLFQSDMKYSVLFVQSSCDLPHWVPGNHPVDRKDIATIQSCRSSQG